MSKELFATRYLPRQRVYARSFFSIIAEVLKDDSTRTVGGGERFSGVRGIPTTGRRYVRDIIPFVVSTSRGFTSVIIVSAILVNVVRGISLDIMMCHYWTRYDIALIYGLDYNAIQSRPGFGSSFPKIM